MPLSPTVRFLAEQIEHVAIESIEPHPLNPNEGDVGAITESVDAVGFYSVVFVQASSRRIVAGESRWRSLLGRGATTAPVVFLDIDDETAVRIMVGDNEIPRRTSRPDDARLAVLLVDLSQQSAHGIAGTGFDLDGLDRLVADVAQRSLGTTGATDDTPERQRCECCGQYVRE